MTAWLLPVFVVLLVVLLCVCVLRHGWDELCDDVPSVIRFGSFVKFYAINPSRWILQEDYVICIVYPLKENALFRFSFCDWLRYTVWRKHILAQAEREREAEQQKARCKRKAEQQNKDYQTMIAAVRQDIEKTEKDMYETIEKAKGMEGKS